MKVTVLMENMGPRRYFTAHGLSMLAEGKNQTVLVDSGPDENFAANSREMGCDLGKVDFCVLSHAHHDHGGGLKKFLEVNSHAPIYLRPQAFYDHSGDTGYNGLDRTLEGNPRLSYTDKLQRLSDTALVFSEVESTQFVSEVCAVLLENGEPDKFRHEQNLLIEEDGKLFLFGGCAHCGIVNIMERAIEIAGRAPDYVFSGFHLALRDMIVSDEFAEKMALKLLSYGSTFYTCHCTGLHPFEVMQRIMGDKLQYASTGCVFEF